MCFYHVSYADFYNSAINRARKPHRCEECGLQIEPGEQYLYCRGKCDGDMYSTYTCLRCCYDIARIVAHEYDDGCVGSSAWPPLGDVGDYFCENDLGRTPVEDVPAYDWKSDWPNAVIKSLRRFSVEGAQLLEQLEN